jgi:tryptophanyl-tRNA synthetase
MSKQAGKQRILSGMRATGRLHLGNYMGAAKGMLQLQDDPAYETFYMVADLHTLTTPYDKALLKEQIRDIIIDYLAVGLDPQKSVIFIQSQIPQHAELAFLFSTVTTVAKMMHLPTYKEKVKQYPENANMALLNYPILMAADILLYMAPLVPVGIDQEPHLEVTREIARRMNQDFGTVFPEPQRFATKGEYVPSLTGEGKMSKSVEGSFIALTDDLSTIQRKLAGAPTDSGKGQQAPTTGGVANLFKFVELFEGEEKRKELENAYIGSGVKYKEIKESLAQAIFEELAPIQERRQEIVSKPEFVKEVIDDGMKRASVVANETICEVKEKMGLL